MNKIARLIAGALFLMPAFWVPASLLAQSPFDGTWRINLKQSKLSSKPLITFSLNNGRYDCASCSPEVHVTADGQDQAAPSQTYDTISVREIDPRSIAITTKKDGKTVMDQIRTVSENGKTLTVKTTVHPQSSDQPMSSEVTATRVGKAVPGANRASGSWRIKKAQESENGLTTTYKTSGDELSMSQATGESYTAKLDGKDYPVKGSYSSDSVALKRIDDRTIEETLKRNGKVVQESKLSVAPDGKKMTMVVTSTLTGRTSTYVSEKQ